MRRREFIKVIACSAVTWPLAAYAQQSALPVIGFLRGVSPGPFAQRLAAFRQGLNETGIVDGQNVAIEYRWQKSPIRSNFQLLPLILLAARPW